MDNYVCTLDQASIKKAKDELNEIPEDRLAAVQAFREWIQSQPHIRCPKTDTHFLLRFLRWSKFSQVRAREKFEDYLNQRVTLPKTFPDIDTKEKGLADIIKAGYCFPLPKRDSKGRQILMCRAEHIERLYKKYGNAGLFRAITVGMEYIHRIESVQVNGVVFFCDFYGLAASTVTKMLTPDTGNLNKMWLKSNPGRFKEIHYYRIGVLMDSFFMFLKLFMPKKLMDRIKTHDTMESVYEYVPKELWPLEYLPDDYKGESAGHYDDVIDKYLKAIAEDEVRNELLHITSNEFGIDEKKRPAETVTQHFRKLNVE